MNDESIPIRLSEAAPDRRAAVLAAQFADSPDAILVVDDAGIILVVNPRFHELSGLPSEWTTLTQAERQPYLFGMLVDPRQGGAFTLRTLESPESEFTEHFPLADGRWVEVNARPLRDRAGERLGRVFHYRDITARKSAEAALRESEELFHTVAEAAPCGIWLQQRGMFTYVNQRLAQLSGYTQAELSQPGALLSVLHPEDRPALATVIANRTAGSTEPLNADVRFVTKAGETRWVRLNGGLLVIKGERYGIGAAIEITDAKRAEEERDRFFQLSVDLLAVTDGRGRFQRVNPAWTETTGYDASELVGSSLWHYVHPDDRAVALAQDSPAQRPDLVRDWRARFRHKSGQYIWLSWSFRRDGQDSTYCAVRDVSELVAAGERQEWLMEALRSNAFVLAQQAAELDGLRSKAEYEASHDVLTSLTNRRAWFAQAVAIRPAAVAIFDIDHFKSVNDRFGHPAGDAVLREVAVRFSSALEGSGAMVGRVGGEEFAAFFNGSFSDARELVAHALESVRSAPIVLDNGRTIEVTASAGLAAWHRLPLTREQSLAATYERADRALLEAKQSGRDRFVVYSLKAA